MRFHFSKGWRGDNADKVPCGRSEFDTADAIDKLNVCCGTVEDDTSEDIEADESGAATRPLSAALSARSGA